MEALYKLSGWSLTPNGCDFSIELCSGFAQKTVRLKTSDENQRHVQGVVQKMVGYKYARANFWEDTCFISSFSVQGDCCCLGVSGSELPRINAPFPQHKTITYNSHNVDTRNQAFDLLSAFVFWIETAQEMSTGGITYART